MRHISFLYYCGNLTFSAVVFDRCCCCSFSRCLLLFLPLLAFYFLFKWEMLDFPFEIHCSYADDGMEYYKWCLNFLHTLFSFSIGFYSLYNFHNMRIVRGAVISKIEIDVAYIFNNRTMFNGYKTQISIWKCANGWCQLSWTKRFAISQVRHQFYYLKLFIWGVNCH